MDRTLKIVAWVAIAIVAFWVLLQVVGMIFSFVTWVVSMLITLAILAVVLFAGYYIVSSLLGGSSTSTDRQRIYE